MKAINLIAGRGSRLKPLTDLVPKCLTEVNGKAILINTLESIANAGLDRCTLVIGYMGEAIKKRIGNRFKNVDIEYIENKIYNKTNSGFSLWLALKETAEDVLILEGDVYYEPQLLIRFIEESSNNSTIVESYRKELDGSFVEVNNGKVIDWVHKTKRPKDYRLEDKFKTVNIHKFDKYFLNNILKPYLEKNIKENEGKNPLEYVMQEIVKDHPYIEAFKTQGQKWFEIDTIEELDIAEKLFKKI